MFVPSKNIRARVISETTVKNKIINAIVIAAAAIIILGLLYTYSLNANFKQLFKAVSAIAAGNYRRKARFR